MKNNEKTSKPVIGLIFLMGCASGHDKFGPDSDKEEGSSPEKAIIVDSVDAEYNWLNKHYPGYSLIMQRLAEHDGKACDVMDIITAEGVEKEVYFDISGFFGKY